MTGTKTNYAEKVATTAGGIRTIYIPPDNIQILSGGILERGDFVRGDFVLGDIVWGDIVRGDIVLEPNHCRQLLGTIV